MINYISVARPDYSVSKNGNIVTTLPHNCTSLQDIRARDIPVLHKLMMLTEQFILAKNIDDMMYQDNQDISHHLIDIKSVVQSVCPSYCREINQDTYGRYKSGVEKLMFGYTFTNALIDMFNDYTVFPRECRILPKRFYEPFLSVASKTFATSRNKTYHNALILTPALKENAVVYSPSFSHTCQLDKYLPDDDYNNQLGYLLRFDWTPNNWITLLDSIGTFCINTQLPTYTKANKSLSHFVKAIEHRTLSPILNYSEVKHKLFTVLRTSVSDISKTPYIESIQFMLQQMHYADGITSILSKQVPTGNDVMHFNAHPELSFLSNIVLRHAMEAANTDGTEEDDTDADEDDVDIEENTTNENTDENTDVDSNNNMDDDTSDTTENNDNAFGDFGDTSGDDSSDDSSTNSSEETTAEIKVDKVPVPEDPFSVVLKIVTSETIDDYLFRNELINAITALVIDPPATMPAEDLRFLKIWVTQWINLVSVETTKSILSKLSIFID